MLFQLVAVKVRLLFYYSTLKLSLLTKLFDISIIQSIGRNISCGSRNMHKVHRQTYE